MREERAMADLVGLIAMAVLGTPMMVGLTIARNAYHNRKLKELNARRQRLYSRRARPAPSLYLDEAS